MVPSAAFLSLQPPPLRFSKSPTACMAAAPACLGFKNLLETYAVSVQRAEGRALNVPLLASARLDGVENVAVRVELRNGCVGWGESPAEDQAAALAAVAVACRALLESPGKSLAIVLAEIGGMLPGHSFASVSFIQFFVILT